MRAQGTNLPRDSLHQGSPYLHSQEALSVPSKALKPKKPRSSSCPPHRNHFSLHRLNVDIIWSVLALKEQSLFLQVAELLQLWDGLEADQLCFLSLSNHFRDIFRDWSHYLKQGSEQEFPHHKMKKWEGPFFWPETEASYFERERGLMGKTMIQQRIIWFKTLSCKEDIFPNMFACNAWSSPREQQVLCYVWLLSELLFVPLLFTTVCYNFLTPSHIPYE